MDFIHLHRLLNADQPDVIAAPYATAEGDSIAIEVTGCNRNPEYKFYRNGTLDCEGHHLENFPGSAAEDIRNYLNSQDLRAHIINDGSINDKYKGDSPMEDTYENKTEKLNKQLRKDALKLVEDRIKRDAASDKSKKAHKYLKQLHDSMDIPYEDFSTEFVRQLKKGKHGSKKSSKK